MCGLVLHGAVPGSCSTRTCLPSCSISCGAVFTSSVLITICFAMLILLIESRCGFRDLGVGSSPDPRRSGCSVKPRWVLWRVQVWISCSIQCRVQGRVQGEFWGGSETKTVADPDAAPMLGPGFSACSSAYGSSAQIFWLAINEPDQPQDKLLCEKFSLGRYGGDSRQQSPRPFSFQREWNYLLNKCCSCEIRRLPSLSVMTSVSK